MKNPTLLLNGFNRAQTQLVVQTADLPLGTLADMVENHAIDLQPGFQRRERWSPEKQSALIESFLLNVPVPPLYLAEEELGTYTAIDGKQRLRAISEFMHDRLPLRNLERLSEAENFRYSDLPIEVSNAFKLRPFIRVVTLLKQTDPTLKYEVFLRLNRGGEILNAQEIRNVAYRGSLNDLIYKLAENDFLKQQLKIQGESSSAYKLMADAEYILRFLMLNEHFENFSGRLVDEMNEYMRQNQRADKVQLQLLQTSFDTAIERCDRLWGGLSFKRPEGVGWRDQFLAGMFDAQMLSVVRLSPADFARAQSRGTDVVKDATRNLFDDSDFEKAVRTGTNTPNRIIYRVSKVQEMLQGL